MREGKLQPEPQSGEIDVRVVAEALAKEAAPIALRKIEETKKRKIGLGDLPMVGKVVYLYAEEENGRHTWREYRVVKEKQVRHVPGYVLENNMGKPPYEIPESVLMEEGYVEKEQEKISERQIAALKKATERLVVLREEERSRQIQKPKISAPEGLTQSPSWFSKVKSFGKKIAALLTLGSVFGQKANVNEEIQIPPVPPRAEEPAELREETALNDRMLDLQEKFTGLEKKLPKTPEVAPKESQAQVLKREIEEKIERPSVEIPVKEPEMVVGPEKELPLPNTEDMSNAQDCIEDDVEKLFGVNRYNKENITWTTLKNTEAWVSLHYGQGLPDEDIKNRSLVRKLAVYIKFVYEFSGIEPQKNTIETAGAYIERAMQEIVRRGKRGELEQKLKLFTDINQELE